eukprot:2453132-Prymnesium_polylepis.1
MRPRRRATRVVGAARVRGPAGGGSLGAQQMHEERGARHARALAEAVLARCEPGTDGVVGRAEEEGQLVGALVQPRARLGRLARLLAVG